MLTTSFNTEIEELLGLKLNSTVKINSVKSLSGGSINQACKLETNRGDFFLKFNMNGRFPGMFNAEVKGLALLRSTNTVGIPEVIACGKVEENEFLLLEMLNASNKKPNYWEVFGKELALLHYNLSPLFGLDHNNYIGSLQQSNKQHLSGIDFMIKERFEPMVKLAYEKQLLDKKQLNLFESLYIKLQTILPNESASLLHGDLWNGNFVTGAYGKAWLIDPAVYFGYRETDLAMAQLFGGFDKEFFIAYNEVFPLQKDWKKRVALFQLYPLLVHLNLFGSGYRKGVLDVLKKYC